MQVHFENYSSIGFGIPRLKQAVRVATPYAPPLSSPVGAQPPRSPPSRRNAVVLFHAVLDLGPMYATDRQTDVGQKHRLMLPPRGGGIITLITFQESRECRLLPITMDNRKRVTASRSAMQCNLSIEHTKVRLPKVLVSRPIAR